MSTNKKSKQSTVALVQAFIAGIQKHFASTASLSFNNQTMSPAALTAIFQAYLAAVLAVATSKGQYASSVQAQKAALAAMKAVLGPFTTYLRGQYGAEPSSLADFGLTPLVRRATKVKVAAQAVDLRAETRALRHTMGARQRLDVKAIAVTPVAAAATPATTVAAPSNAKE